MGYVNDPVRVARAAVLHDLEVSDVATPANVDRLEDAVAQRRWWLEQWAEGSPYVVGLVAQDVQDALLEAAGRWPLCQRCEGPAHALYVDPDIGGPNPRWVCEQTSTVIAAVGGL